MRSARRSRRVKKTPFRDCACGGFSGGWDGGEAAAAVACPPAALRIRISHPHLVSDLVRFLKRMGFAVEDCGFDTILVRLPEGDSPVLRAQLELYVHVWQATRAGISAVVEPVDAP